MSRFLSPSTTPETAGNLQQILGNLNASADRASAEAQTALQVEGQKEIVASQGENQRTMQKAQIEAEQALAAAQIDANAKLQKAAADAQSKDYAALNEARAAEGAADREQQDTVLDKNLAFQEEQTKQLQKHQSDLFDKQMQLDREGKRAVAKARQAARDGFRGEAEKLYALAEQTDKELLEVTQAIGALELMNGLLSEAYTSFEGGVFDILEQATTSKAAELDGVGQQAAAAFAANARIALQSSPAGSFSAGESGAFGQHVPGASSVKGDRSSPARQLVQKAVEATFGAEPHQSVVMDVMDVLLDQSHDANKIKAALNRLASIEGIDNLKFYRMVKEIDAQATTLLTAEGMAAVYGEEEGGSVPRRFGERARAVGETLQRIQEDVDEAGVIQSGLPSVSDLQGQLRGAMRAVVALHQDTPDEALRLISQAVGDPSKAPAYVREALSEEKLMDYVVNFRRLQEDAIAKTEQQRGIDVMLGASGLEGALDSEGGETLKDLLANQNRLTVQQQQNTAKAARLDKDQQEAADLAILELLGDTE